MDEKKPKTLDEQWNEVSQKAGITPREHYQLAVRVFFSDSNRKKDVLERMLPYWYDAIVPRLARGEQVLVAAHGNSLRALVKHLDGICHVYVHPSAILEQAVEIVHNSKVQRPGVCNALETLLLDRDLAESTGRAVLERLVASGVELRGDDACRAKYAGLPWKIATESDWDEEYLDLVIAVAEVSGSAQAVDHVAAHGSGHTDSIVTQDASAAEEFVLGCDSSSVMVNASTRFADGGEYGLGAEIGISTDKLHARGPMGASDLCTYKWIVRGNGQVRK